MKASKLFVSFISFIALSSINNLFAERFINQAPFTVKVTVLDITEDHEIGKFALLPGEQKSLLLLQYFRKGVVIAAKKERSISGMNQDDIGQCDVCGNVDCSQNRSCLDCNGITLQINPCDMNKHNVFHVVSDDRCRLNIKISSSK